MTGVKMSIGHDSSLALITWEMCGCARVEPEADTRRLPHLLMFLRQDLSLHLELTDLVD